MRRAHTRCPVTAAVLYSRVFRRSGLVASVLCGAGYVSCGGRAQSSSDAVLAGAGGTAGTYASRAGAPSAGSPPVDAAAGDGGVSQTASAGAGGTPGEGDDCERGGDVYMVQGGATANLNPTSIAPRALQLIADDSAWSSRQVVGMAAGPQSAFIATTDEVDQVDASKVTRYLTVQEAANSAGLGVAAGFRALDIDANGALYSILSSTVIRSDAPHQAAVFRRDPSLAVQLGVVAPDDVVLVSMQSMFRVMPHCAQRLFTNGEFLGLDCGGAQLTVAHSGTFLYAADCGVNEPYRGTSDGASFDVIYAAGTRAAPPLNATQFMCSTRDPTGGFYLVIDDGKAWQLVHLSDNPSGNTGLDPIATLPTFAQARDANPSLGRPLPFTNCKLAAEADGTLYLQTESLLFSLTVPPS